MTSDHVVDLRSDTVTKPTAGMREAIASAEVGDDVFGDDPTVIALERRVAAMFGMEAALFVPSGTMSNQLAVRTHTQPGDEMFCDAMAHERIRVERGRFGAMMDVSLVNDGPVTIILDSRKRF